MSNKKEIKKNKRIEESIDQNPTAALCDLKRIALICLAERKKNSGGGKAEETR
ncbi:MAG TPA: hypothetical protein PKY87_05485 [Terricaulis sp.]|nr:hypothetical protein [Terricaulis sp.]